MERTLWKNDRMDKLKKTLIHPDLRIIAKLIKQDPDSWIRREINLFLERNDLRWSQENDE